MRLTENSALSLELTKKIFISAWMQISEYDGSINFSTWLTKVAAFTILEELKKIEKSEIAPADTASNNFDKELMKLPESERIVFVLHDIEKFSHEEVAELLVFPIKESKKLLIKARLKLMKALL